MKPGLTGRTRCRLHRTFWGWTLLVFQVEVGNTDHDFSPYPTYWRDATVEDLTVIDNAKEN